MFTEFPHSSLYAYPVPLLTGEPASSAFSEFASTLGAVRNEHPTAIYIHVPFCLHICNFCGFTKSDQWSQESVRAFTKQTISEVRSVCNHLAISRQKIHAIFFGGGTASVLPLSCVEHILSALHQAFDVLPEAERTFEGDCLTLRTPEYLTGLRSLGFTRLSFGVQVLNPDMRSILNLRPTRQQLASLSRAASQLFPEVAIDYIYGWPNQTEEFVIRDLSNVIQCLAPTTIDLFQFEPLDARPEFLARMYEAGATLPSSAARQECRRAAVSVLEDSSFCESNYTKFSRQITPISSPSYGSCYYGWNNGQVLGFGRGSQSFFRGGMWGNALGHDEYVHQLAVGNVPIAHFAGYAEGERELVTWPRRGWIASDSCHETLEYSFKLQELSRKGFIFDDSRRCVLTSTGRDWVPSLLHFLMPGDQQRAFDRETRERLGTRIPAGATIE